MTVRAVHICGFVQCIIALLVSTTVRLGVADMNILYFFSIILFVTGIITIIIGIEEDKENEKNNRPKLNFHLKNKSEYAPSNPWNLGGESKRNDILVITNLLEVNTSVVKEISIESSLNNQEPIKFSSVIPALSEGNSENLDCDKFFKDVGIYDVCFEFKSNIGRKYRKKLVLGCHMTHHPTISKRTILWQWEIIENKPEILRKGWFKWQRIKE